MRSGHGRQHENAVTESNSRAQAENPRRGNLLASEAGQELQDWCCQETKRCWVCKQPQPPRLQTLRHRFCANAELLGNFSLELPTRAQQADTQPAALLHPARQNPVWGYARSQPEQSSSEARPAGAPGGTRAPHQAEVKMRSYWREPRAGLRG